MDILEYAMKMEQDGEGKQIMKVLGKNMGWLLNLMEAGKKEVPPPEQVVKTATNFIR